MVSRGTLDSLMKSLSLSNAILASRAGSWDKYCTLRRVKQLLPAASWKQHWNPRPF